MYRNNALQQTIDGKYDKTDINFIESALFQTEGETSHLYGNTYMNKREIVKKAFIKSLPVMAAYEVLGAGFGILMSRNGYHPVWSFLSSLFIFAGSMQFVLADLLVSAAPVLTTAVMTVMINARHLFYGISMVNRYRDKGRYRPYLIFALTDETYSLLCDETDYLEEYKGLYCFLVSLFNQFYWVSGTVIGAAAGTLLSFDSSGIEFSMTALFVTVFTEQWLTSAGHRPALAGLLATALCLAVFGRSSFLIPAMILITILLSVPYVKRKRNGGSV